MHDRNRKFARRGLVISDLHLFARRSNGFECIESLRPDFSSLDVLVLNGDIFDFRWSTLATAEETQVAAVAWLSQLARDYPRCQIHYLQGNHDCLDDFRQRLATLSAGEPRFHCHDYHLVLGSALFLHGDCANRPMDARGLERLRARWKRHRRFGRLAAELYFLADRLGLTQLIHQCFFPRRRTVTRIAFYLDDALPGWRSRIRDCYFGHTHLPFVACEHEGVLFHNTGSANGNLGFGPIFFDAGAGSA